MTPTTGTQPAKADLRRSQLGRSTAMRLAGTEYARFADALDQLTPGDWKLPTDCPGWDVQTVAGHVLGMAEMAASVRDGARQLRSATKAGGVFLDSLTALQVREHAGLTPAELQGRLRKIGPKATRGRRQAPGFIRHRRMPFLQEVGGHPEWWAIGYLTDIILTRDPWMHRIDLARATGHPMRLTAEHDGVLVADIVTEWAARHGQPYTLHLTGPAGGTWTSPGGGPELELDAVDFCRTLSGRKQGTGLLAEATPF
jgi:uncharacterized protein (TIGR03083 family)